MTMYKMEPELDSIQDHVNNLILSDKRVNDYLDGCVRFQWPLEIPFPQTAEERTENQLWWNLRNEALLSLLVTVGFVNRSRYVEEDKSTSN